MSNYRLWAKEVMSNLIYEQDCDSRDDALDRLSNGLKTSRAVSVKYGGVNLIFHEFKVFHGDEMIARIVPMGMIEVMKSDTHDNTDFMLLLSGFKTKILDEDYLRRMS